MRGFALGLTLKQRRKATCKSPILAADWSEIPKLPTIIHGIMLLLMLLPCNQKLMTHRLTLETILKPSHGFLLVSLLFS